MNRRPTLSILRLLTMALLAIGMGGIAGVAPVSAQNATATLIVDVYTCGPLNDPIDPNETLINECNLGTDDISFSLEALPFGESGAGASTGTGGAPATLTFSQLTPGNYRLTQETPATIGLSYISQCTSNVREFDYPFSPFAIIEPGGRINIELLAGEELTCGWYNVQNAEPETSALTITAYSCDGDVIDPALCDLAAGVEFAITNSDGSVEQQITTDASGIATFDGTGEFKIVAVSELPDRDFCVFDAGDLPSGGTVTLGPAKPIAIDAYYCYPGA